MPQRPAAQHLCSGDSHDLVSVHDLSGLVYQDGAVCVAIERHANLCASFAHQALDLLGMQRPAVAVDVLPIWGHPNRGDPGAQLL